MIVSNIPAKLVSLNVYNKKDEKGNKTDVKGYMFTLAIDFKNDNYLNNRVIMPLCCRDFELVGDVENYSFGDDLLVTLDLPIVLPGDEGKMPIMLLELVGV